MLNRTFSTSTSSRRRVRRTLVALTLTAGLGVSLAACGDDSRSGHSPSATQTASNGDVFNAADGAFATDMIQHHAQALAMVDMTAGRDLDPEVAQLTEDIRAAQGPEIEQMADWLTAWDQEVPETMRDHANAHDMDDMDDMGEDDMGEDDMGEDDMGGTDHGDSESAESEMPGMMSAEDMDALENASDAEFQDMWLEMMVEHHQGAIEMAQDEVDNGTFDDAVALAENIISSQQDEIDQMEELLG